MECAPPEVVCEVLVEEVGEEDTHCSSALATLDHSKSILLLPPLPLRFVLLSLSLCELASLRCCMESASQNASRRRTAAAATADASVVAAVVLWVPRPPPLLLSCSSQHLRHRAHRVLPRSRWTGRTLGATKFWEKMGSDIIVGEADVAAAVVDDDEDEEEEALADLGAFLANHFDKPPALDSSWVKLPKESPRVVMGVTRAISRRVLAPLRSSDTDRSAFSFSALETDDDDDDDDDDDTVASSEALKPG